MTTDCDFVLSMLEQGPATTMMLIRQSIHARGCGLTPHSRVADLRRDGYDIRCARVGSQNGRGIYQYTLLASGGVMPAASEPSATSPSTGVTESFPVVGQAQAAGPVEPPAVAAEPGGAEIPVALPDVIPGQLELIA